MPWFPDFAGAAELARRQRRQAGRADPVGQYLNALRPLGHALAGRRLAGPGGDL